MTPMDVGREQPTSALATRLLQRYYEELDARFTGGFEVAPTVAAPDDDLVPPRGVLLVAYLDESPVGCGAVRKLDATAAEIKRMWIDPAVRGRGVGRRLLSALEEAGVDLGCRVVRLDTRAELQEALGMYRSAGYHPIAPYNDNPYATHWLEKRLP